MSYHKSVPAKIKSQSIMNQSAHPDQKGKKAKKSAPKKITTTYLHNAGLYYLERFACSKQHFINVMIRKVKKSCAAHVDQDFEACRQMVTDLADRFEESGLLNDTLYTQGVVASMRRKGASTSAITQKLKSKGIENSKEVLGEYDQAEHVTSRDAEFSAALVFAQKKKIGPYFISGAREQNISQHAQNKKWLSAFARAGFSYEISSKVITMNRSDIDNQLYQP